MSIEKKHQQWVIICYGNILRSQVLEQYLRYYSKQQNKNIEFCSAGIAKSEEFPNTTSLLKEVAQELTNRNIPYSLNRTPFDSIVKRKVAFADIVIVADNNIKKNVLEQMGNSISKKKIFTFYEIINEGEKDFEDTYDYIKKKQDPIRFKNAFDELERISLKILRKV